MFERHRARQAALEILYASEITGLASSILAKRRFAEPDDPIAAFCCQILDGVAAHLSKIDKLVDEYAQNWVIERLPVIDKNILRIAIYEMLYEPMIPPSVSINEAVELGKEYGSSESSKFINGVLGQLAVHMERAAVAPTSGQEEVK